MPRTTVLRVNCVLRIIVLGVKGRLRTIVLRRMCAEDYSPQGQVCAEDYSPRHKGLSQDYSPDKDVRGGLQSSGSDVNRGLWSSA